MHVQPRPAVDRLHRQRRGRRHVDGGAVGGLKVARLQRHGPDLIFARPAAAGAEAAHRRHAVGERVVAVPQQVGRRGRPPRLGLEVALPAVQLLAGEFLDRTQVALDHFRADPRRVARARLDVGHHILPVAPAGGVAGPADAEVRPHALEGRGGRDVRVAEAAGVVAQQVGVGVAAVGARGHAQRFLQAGVQPAAEGLAGLALDHGGRMVGGQLVVHPLQVLAGQVAEVLGHDGAGADGEGESGRGRGGEKSVHRSVSSGSLEQGVAALNPIGPRLANPAARRRRTPPSVYSAPNAA